MKRFLCLMAALLCLFPVFGCAAKMEEYTFFAMDTFITLRLPGDAQKEAAEAERLLLEIENSLSRTRTSADVYRVNESTDGIADADSHLLAVLDFSLQMAEVTGGAFSPAMGALSDLWNINGGGPVPSPEAIEEAKRHADYRVFLADGASVTKTDRETKLDFGAVGKGYAAQKLTEYLRQHMDWGLVSLGGNVGVFGQKPDGTPYKIGITNPKDTSSPMGYLLIEGGFVSVSGDYERFFDENGVRYHHILDPETGYPADSGLSSAAVWSRDGAKADALSTALFVMGAQKAMEYHREHPGEFEAILITKENKIILTPGLVWGENFLADDRFRYPQ
ncbi:MAG: FAD:protein FMN transferase [Clostridia bacterium]|nr:FAD:protein FMN transferase [Clostridia bacterium]